MSFFTKLGAIIGFYFVVASHAHAADPVHPLIQQADAHFKDEYFYQASFFYQKALDISPQHAYAHFQIAECYRNLFHYENAKSHYEEVYKLENDKYPLAGYYLALMYKLTGEYGQSVHYFDDFLAFASQHRFSQKALFIQQAQQEKEGSIYALNNTLKPKGRFSFMALTFPVNSTFNDYAPAVFHHDSCLLITSTRPPAKNSGIDHQYGEYYSDHYLFCKTEKSIWEDKGKTNNLPALNTKFSEGSGFFLEAEQAFYFTGCYQEGYCHIYKTILQNGEWQPPVPLNEKINIAGFESKQPSLSPGGDTLYFVSNRQGGFGGQDIWMSMRKGAENWEQAVNLGPAINTSLNEVSPYYYPDENLLFFASNGHQGFGGFDLYMGEMGGAKSDIAVTNLGPPFNSYKDDLYLTLGKQKGFLSSNRNNEKGDFEIYTFKISSSQAVLLSVQNNQSFASDEFLDELHFLTSQDQQNFEELPLEERIKIKRYIEMRAFREIVAEKAVLNNDLLVFYEQLPTQEKEFIDRMVMARSNMLLRENEEVLLTEDEYYYQNLPLAKKEKIERIVEARFYLKTLHEDADTFNDLQVFFESLPLERKEAIRRTLGESKKFATKSFQDNTSLEDLFFYHALPAEEKEAIERAFNKVRFDQKTSQQAGLKDEAQAHYFEQLPLETREQIQRIIMARQFTAIAMKDNSKLASSAEDDRLDIGTLAIGNPKNISIEGKITYKGKPANAIKVGLASDDEQDGMLTVTNQEGNFRFFNVDYHQQQKIFFGEEDVKFMNLAQYTLEELKITVLQDTIIKQTFDNIYFETNQYTIPSGALSILDSLVQFHRKYKDVQIEISAYADTVGSTSYNLQLSQKRARATYQYLVGKGVDATALHIYGKGKEIPKDGQDLKYSRRVEFELQGVATSYNPTREVYVVQPQPDLKKIAAKYGLALQALKKLNPGITDTPRPFTPVRILANE